MNKRTAFSVDVKLLQNQGFIKGNNDINVPVVNENLLVEKE
ncbi:MAG: hypothetical protein ACRDE2_11305 [Chitinophagaceae bacterium]